MIIQTKYHGEMEAADTELWHFQNGIPGFPEEKRFFLYPLGKEETFSILQSAYEQQIAFVVTNPFAFFPNYDFSIDEASVATLELEKAEDALPYVIWTLGETMDKSTANLQAPVILNTKNRSGKQIILHDTAYTTKHFIQKKAEKR